MYHVCPRCPAPTLSPTPPLIPPHHILLGTNHRSFLHFLGCKLLIYLLGPLPLPWPLLDIHLPSETAKGHLRLGWPPLPLRPTAPGLTCHSTSQAELLYTVGTLYPSPPLHPDCEVLGGKGLHLSAWNPHHLKHSTWPTVEASEMFVAVVIDRIQEIRPPVPYPSRAWFTSAVL